MGEAPDALLRAEAQLEHGGSFVYGIAPDEMARIRDCVVRATATPRQVAAFTFEQLAPPALLCMVPGWIALLHGSAGAYFIPVHIALAVFFQMVCANAYIYVACANVPLHGTAWADILRNSVFVVTGMLAIDGLIVVLRTYAMGAPAQYYICTAMIYFVISAYLVFLAGVVGVCAFFQRGSAASAWADYVAERTHPCHLHQRCICTCTICTMPLAEHAAENA